MKNSSKLVFSVMVIAILISSVFLYVFSISEPQTLGEIMKEAQSKSSLKANKTTPGKSSSLTNSVTVTPLEKYMFQKYDGKGYNGYTLVMAIQQPVEGSRDFISDQLDTGHIFIRLAKSGEKSWVSYFSYNEELDDDIDKSGKVYIHKDAVGPFTLAKVFEVSEESSKKVLQYLWSRYNDKSNYDLANNNCVTFALNAAKSAGIAQESLGIVPRKWQITQSDLEDPFVSLYFEDLTNNVPKDLFGYSSADAAEDLKSTGGVFYAKDIK